MLQACSLKMSLNSDNIHAVDIEKPLMPLPGSYGIPFFSAIKDRLDYFYNQGQYKYFYSRVAKYKSTVIRINSIPGPFCAEPRMVALCDAKSFVTVLDPSKVLKMNTLLGNFMPSPAFTGGYRVCAYLDPSEPKHTTIKQVYLNALVARKSSIIPTFLSCFNSLFDNMETELKTTNKSEFSSPCRAAAFDYVCEALLGSKPGADVRTNALKYIFLQTHQNMTVGMPKLVEDLLLHTFPFPSFLARSATRSLYAYFSSAGSWIIDKGEKVGLSRDEACHNLIFLLIANAYLGVNACLPRLFKWVVAAGPELQARLGSEIRSVIAAENGEVTVSGLEKMELVKSTAYEALRIDPPVQIQYARAKEDLIVESHEARYEVKKGELLGGFQPMATRDPKVFDRAEEFVAERFMGEEGKKLLKYLYWANGPETETVTAVDKVCAGKEMGAMVARLLLVVMFLRYDTIAGEISDAMEDVMVTVTGMTKAEHAGAWKRSGSGES